MLATTAFASDHDDVATVAALDTAYQAAVEQNDWQAMDRVLHPEFVLILGNGTAYHRAQLLDMARNRKNTYVKQMELPGTQTVRLYGKDTARVTALLWLKGERAATKEPFEHMLWFTDTYVRTDDGWKYVFGQASLPLPKGVKLLPEKQLR